MIHVHGQQVQKSLTYTTSSSVYLVGVHLQTALGYPDRHSVLRSSGYGNTFRKQMGITDLTACGFDSQNEKWIKIKMKDVIERNYGWWSLIPCIFVTREATLRIRCVHTQTNSRLQNAYPMICVLKSAVYVNTYASRTLQSGIQYMLYTRNGK